VAKPELASNLPRLQLIIAVHRGTDALELAGAMPDLIGEVTMDDG
jgi:hypothetical protein